MYSVACVTTPTYTHHITPLPIVVRADTREFIGFRFADTISVNRVIQIIMVAHPSEAAMCLYGYAQDTIFLAPKFMNPLDSIEIYRKIAIIDSVEIADVDKVGSTFILYEDGVACDPNKRLIAIAHSHPTTVFQPPESCNHSDLDAIFIHMKEQKYWFSLVFCAHANSLLWADGRRKIFYFVESKNNSDSNFGVDNYLPDNYINMMKSIRILNFN